VRWAEFEKPSGLEPRRGLPPLINRMSYSLRLAASWCSNSFLAPNGAHAPALWPVTLSTTPDFSRGHAAVGGTMLFVGLRFHLSPGVGGADRNRPVDGGPGSKIAALWCRLRQSHGTIIHRRGFLLRAFCGATRSLFVLIRHNGRPCGVKVYRDMRGADSSPDSSRGAPRPMILKDKDDNFLHVPSHVTAKRVWCPREVQVCYSISGAVASGRCACSLDRERATIDGSLFAGRRIH